MNYRGVKFNSFRLEENEIWASDDIRNTLPFYKNNFLSCTVVPTSLNQFICQHLAVSLIVFSAVLFFLMAHFVLHADWLLPSSVNLLCLLYRMLSVCLIYNNLWSRSDVHMWRCSCLSEESEGIWRLNTPIILLCVFTYDELFFRMLFLQHTRERCIFIYEF